MALLLARVAGSMCRAIVGTEKIAAGGAPKSCIALARAIYAVTVAVAILFTGDLATIFTSKIGETITFSVETLSMTAAAI